MRRRQPGCGNNETYSHVSSTHPSLSACQERSRAKPGTGFEQAMDKLYSRIECRLSQAEGQITFQTMEEMQRPINSVMKQQQRQSRDITQSQKRSPVTAHRDTACPHTSHSPVGHCGRKQRENHGHRGRPMSYS